MTKIYHLEPQPHHCSEIFVVPQNFFFFFGTIYGLSKAYFFRKGLVEEAKHWGGRIFTNSLGTPKFFRLRRALRGACVGEVNFWLTVLQIW